LRALRKQPGDEVEVTDGRGTLFRCRILDEDLSGCTLQVEASVQGPDVQTHHLHMAVSPIKNPSRFEWFLEKATEIGVGTITPILCERTEKQHFKPERYQNLLIAAMKQSGRTVLPTLNPPVSLAKFAPLYQTPQRLIAWCGETEKQSLTSALNPGLDTLILIGPEGDFSPKEVELAIDAGCLPVSLGSARLRTETAAVVACVAYNLTNLT
jgi:16S rRNA (uracil1498-N3)-methyltransferase